MSYNFPRKSRKISDFKGGVAQLSDTLKCEAVLFGKQFWTFRHIIQPSFSWTNYFYVFLSVHHSKTCFNYQLNVQFLCMLHYNPRHFMFELPCIIILYYIKNQQDATLTILFISNCKITLHISDALCVRHQEY